MFAAKFGKQFVSGNIQRIATNEVFKQRDRFCAQLGCSSRYHSQLTIRLRIVKGKRALAVLHRVLFLQAERDPRTTLR